ncbi:MAG TPA: hypothetical protein VF791_20155 [Pyrinomonadaceae bacterium]
MKVKLFTETIGTTQSGINAFTFEEEINKWLGENPEVEILSTHLSSSMMDNYLQALCLIFYRENAGRDDGTRI